MLPLSDASNPYTALNSLEVRKMTLKRQQREFLNSLTEMAQDEELRDAAQEILSAVDVGKALDDAKVERKAARPKVEIGKAKKKPMKKMPMHEEEMEDEEDEEDDEKKEDIDGRYQIDVGLLGEPTGLQLHSCAGRGCRGTAAGGGPPPG